MIKSFLQFKEENTSKSITVTFGRFNPPTIGHGKLLEKIKDVSAGGTYKIFVSHTHDSKKNPLAYTDKVKIMRKMFPTHARNIVLDETVRDPLSVAEYCFKKGFTNLTFVVGGDRLDNIKNLITKYNGVKQSSGAYYKFDTLKFVSAGDRDPDSDDAVEGMSASKLRAYASEGKLDKFLKGLGDISRADGVEIYNKVRMGLGISEETVSKHISLPKVSEVREMYARGEIFPVGSRVLLLTTGENGIVESRGPNFLTLRIKENFTKVWLSDVSPLAESWATDEFKKIAVEKKKSGKKILGFLVIDKDDERYEFSKVKEIQAALSSIDKLESKYKDSFQFFFNGNNQVVFKQTKWTPIYHLT